MQLVTVNGKQGQIVGNPIFPNPTEPTYIVSYKPDDITAVEEIFTEGQIS
jgi:hypothetical protein